MAKIIIPTPLRKFSKNNRFLISRRDTVKEAILELTEIYPEIKDHLFDSQGRIRQFIRIYVGDNDIRSLKQEDTIVDQDTVISIIPAIAGGVKTH
ncbi:MAG: MoaD/ThiS family protein [Bacteroidetes bacterium]|nr:MoaD/ThiS family protein [Bacteroidota bacterium]